MIKVNYPLVSVVVPTYNAEKFIKSAIASVLKTDYQNFEVVLVDDCSSDKTLDIVKRNFSKEKKLRIFQNKKRLLAAGTRNRGCEEASGVYIALLDHDIEVDKNWIKEALKVFQKYKDAGVVQGVVLDIKKRSIIHHAGIMINPYLGWVTSLGFGQDVNKYKPREKEVFADATGLIFKKSVWKKVGGFDEDLAINLDDWDFNWRCWLCGSKQILAPKSITYHWSKTQKTRDAWIKRVFWEFHFAKMPWLFIKNYELTNLIKFLPIYLAVNLFRGLFNIFFRFNFAPLIAFFKSLIFVIAKFPILLRKREKVQKGRKVKDEYLINKLMDNSFIFTYFFKRWLPIISLGKSVAQEEPY